VQLTGNTNQYITFNIFLTSSNGLSRLVNGLSTSLLLTTGRSRSSNSGSTKSSGSKHNRGSYGGHSSSGRASGGVNSGRGNSSSVHEDLPPEVDVELHAEGVHTVTHTLRSAVVVQHIVTSCALQPHKSK
jgi:hypothetical protein